MKNKALTIEDQPKQQSKELFRIVEVDTTPFNVVERTNENEEKEYYVVMGKYRLNNNTFLSEAEAVEWAKEITWEKIMQVVGIVTENWNESKKLSLNN